MSSSLGCHGCCYTVSRACRGGVSATHPGGHSTALTFVLCKLRRASRSAHPRACPRRPLRMHHQGMDQKHDWKQQLPYPYNQDLSGVLRHLDRRTPFSRAKLANDPSTAGYVAAAMRLVERHLGPSAERELADPDDANSIDRPLLQFLSQREVVAAVVGNPDPFPRRGSVAALRSTWRSQSELRR